MNNTINTQQLIDFLLQQQTVEKSIELSSAYKIFFNYLKLHNRKGTLNAYKSALKPIMDFFQNNNIIRTSEVTTDIINKYINMRLPLVKATTINKAVSSIRTMFNLLIKLKYIDKKNFEFSKLPEEKTTIAQISKNDIAKILYYFKKSHKIENKSKLIFMLLLTTGIRTNELLNIKNSNIDLEHKKIYLDFTKSGKTRYIYLIDEIIDLVNEIKSNNTYLFNDHFGNQLSSNAIKCLFRRLKSELDISILSPHKIRHYYATQIYKKSLDIYLVSNLLGHSDIKTTQIYLDIDNKENQIKNSFYNPIYDF